MLAYNQSMDRPASRIQGITGYISHSFHASKTGDARPGGKGYSGKKVLEGMPRLSVNLSTN